MNHPDVVPPDALSGGATSDVDLLESVDEQVLNSLSYAFSPFEPADEPVLNSLSVMSILLIQSTNLC